jgi:hypothetical protein
MREKKKLIYTKSLDNEAKNCHNVKILQLNVVGGINIRNKVMIGIISREIFQRVGDWCEPIKLLEKTHPGTSATK